MCPVIAGELGVCSETKLNVGTGMIASEVFVEMVSLTTIASALGDGGVRECPFTIMREGEKACVTEME